MKIKAIIILMIILLSSISPLIPIKATDTQHTSGKLDFNSGSPTQAGWTGFEGNGYSGAVGYGWTDSSETPIGMASVDRSSGDGILDDLTRDIHYASVERWFKIAVPNGLYQYTWHYGDNGYAHGPFTLADNDGVEATDLSTGGSVWKTYSGTVTVSGGFLYIKIIPQIADNMVSNGIEWNSLSITTTTSCNKSTSLESTTVVTTLTVTLGTSLITTTKSGGTSTADLFCSTISNSNGTTVHVIISQILTTSISVLSSVTDPVVGTLTGYETTTITQTTCSTIGGTSIITIGSDTLTTCITTTSIKTITGYMTSTSSTPVTTKTVNGTSTSTNITATATKYTSTTIGGIVGGITSGWIIFVCVGILVLVSLLLIRRRR
jgi:hypothetical protein